jgi:hypothetical protein
VLFRAQVKTALVLFAMPWHFLCRAHSRRKQVNNDKPPCARARALFWSNKKANPAMMTTGSRRRLRCHRRRRWLRTMAGATNNGHSPTDTGCRGGRSGCAPDVQRHALGFCASRLGRLRLGLFFFSSGSSRQCPGGACALRARP